MEEGAEAAASAAAAGEGERKRSADEADAVQGSPRKRPRTDDDDHRTSTGGWRPKRAAETGQKETRRSALQLWRVASPEWRQVLRDRMRLTGDNMQKISHALQLRNQLQTAMLGMWYMWRFYHGSEGKPAHSFDEFDRRVMMSACLFLASKNENSLFRLGDLVIMAWGHKYRSPEWYQRRQQIVNAELYLIAAMLGFDFSYSLPTTPYCALLRELTGEDGILGMRGIPWCIAGSQLFALVFITPLCTHYSSGDLARCMLRRCRKAWEDLGNMPWCRPQCEGSLDEEEVQVDEADWERLVRVEPRTEAEFDSEMDQVDFQVHFQKKIHELQSRFTRRGFLFSRSRTRTARTCSPDHDGH
eukprot:TRINITY_DN20163_c0_g1_i1.p1 TRINITY_DN20163_c0_g1~~TRINITY_DN20163_c0_g1_i1.p1  ORF type:complete len:358 (+),score=108.88 TRINITY_DN20163_c0_g1_i1:66-1139(+)